MNDQKVFNRWIVVVGAILIQLCLGAIYAWSVFTKKITAVGGDYGFSAKEAAWVFSAGLATFAVVMVIAGRLQAKVGPKPIAMIGGAVLGLGYVLGGFLGSSFASQLICIGIIGGAGIGLAYVVPIAVGVKWFPDKKGMISGLAVAGFGFGATLWVKLAGSWFGGLLNTVSIFGLPGVQSVFVIYGIVFFVLVFIGSLVMVNPPEGYQPEGWQPPESTGDSKATGTVDLTSGEMLRTPQFYFLWLMFVGSGLAGLMVIYCIRLFGIDALQASGAAANAQTAGVIAGTAMAWYAILNGLGRIAWGTISDKIGRKMALFLMCLFQGIIMLFFLKMGASEIGLIIGACIIGFNFGGNFALFPAATADFFGNRNVGTNYGWVFLAYGVAGIAGPQIAGYFKDAAQGGDVGAWATPFIIAGISCIVAAVIGLLLRAPKEHKA
ncbi:MAG: MFS transporter [Candidatus Latescibacteria bacterium]|nr:MFS transporter [bacterium]MBD3423574.1 MFS transporter [Candidatus Latescibacterota bacterium]